MGEVKLNEVKIYEALQKDIADTDDISFKLISFVPLVSGAGLLTANFAKEAVPLPVISIVSLFAAAVTLGLFRWELRNIQTCLWFICLARALEQQTLPSLNFTRPTAPGKIGKREAANIIYTTTIGSWLILPMVTPGFWTNPFWLYVALGPIIAVYAFRAVRTSTDPGSIAMPYQGAAADQPRDSCG
jgi:hypothetical protein